MFSHINCTSLFQKWARASSARSFASEALSSSLRNFINESTVSLPLRIRAFLDVILMKFSSESRSAIKSPIGFSSIEEKESELRRGISGSAAVPCQRILKIRPPTPNPSVSLEHP